MSPISHYNASIVTSRKDKDDYWNSIGRAFPFKTKDGRQGIRIPSLNVVLMEPKDGDDTAENGA